MFYADKEWLVLVDNDMYNFKAHKEAFKFYDKKKEETTVTCVLYEITTKEVDIRYGIN